GRARRPHDQRIPERELVEAMQIDRSKDQLRRHLNHVRLRVRRHMLLHHFRRQPETRRRDEVFLQDLRRKDGGLFAQVRREELARGLLFLRLVSTVRVDENIGVEEPALGHYSTRRRRRRRFGRLRPAWASPSPKTDEGPEILKNSGA